MITSIPSLFSITWVTSWINFSSGFILFGLYYGFLATLPIGPSQLICIRAFLLEGNLGGIIAVSGLITGQLIILLSVYYSPLYVILIKPHILTLSILPYIFFYWYRIKDLLNYQSLRSITSLQDTRIFELFFDSIIFQLLNPIILPNPVLARLFNLFLFRYSDNLLFLTSTILGWLYGQYLFIFLGKLLLFRVESDSPILYLLVKRVIHRTFSIIILSLSLPHLSRTPVPFITKKIIDKLQFNSTKREDLLLSQKLWPNLFFDYRRCKRPFRYIANSRLSTRSPIKRKMSQYFFNICLSDGKPRLSFTYLPSLAIFEKNFGKYINSSKKSLCSSDFFIQWISRKKKRKEYIYNEFKHKVEFLESGFTFGKIREKKTKLSNLEGKTFTKYYNPLLIKQNHEAIIISKSPWFLTDKLKNKQKQQVRERNNKLKNWIYNQWQELEYKNSVLPWEPLTRDARRTLSLLINKSKKINNFKQIHFFDGEIPRDFNEKNNLSLGNVRKKVNRKSNINWELILNLSPRQKILYFNYLQMDEWNTLKNYWKNLLFGDITRLKSLYSFFTKTLKSENKFQFREMNKEIPRWVSDLKNDKFDVIAIGVTDIRQRKVKNLGYLIKGKDKRRKIIRRFSQQSDFRRKLVKGSMRARRRKTLIWKMFQLEINSPFFLRMNEKPAFIQTFSNRPNIYGSELTFQNLFGKNSFLKKTRADRLAIANRWDFPLAQWGRSWLLIIQSHFRKYLGLPVLIILKNICRFLLFQNPEWSEDWAEWNEEIHIRCTYDGTEVSEKELPEQWLRDGLQIKIIYPFRLRPWHNFGPRKKDIRINRKYSEKLVRKQRFHYCYLTAWGFLTDLPFGNIKKQPSFFKPINKELEKIKKNIFFNLFQPIRKKSYKRIETQMNPSKTYLSHLISNQKYQEIRGEKDKNKVCELVTGKKEDFELQILKKYRYEERFIYIQNLEDLITKRNTKKNIYFDKESRFYRGDKQKKTVNKLIQIKQIIIRFCRKNIELIKKWFSFFKINTRKMVIYFYFEIKIIKKSVGYMFSRNKTKKNRSDNNH
nr:hypothetical protein RF1 [Pleurozia subinflata]